MVNINTNLASLIVQSSLNKSSDALNNAIERMTTGFKLNGAKDNAAGYSIAANMTTKINAYQVAEENTLMGIDMIRTASSSLSQMSDILSRMRSLGVQAANGTYGTNSINSITSEVEALINELYRIKGSTEYNGQNLFSSAGSVSNNGSELKLNQDGFLQDIVRRDTTGMAKFSEIDENTVIRGGTYSVSTADELAKLARMVNAGNVSDIEIVLANNIDLSVYSSGSGWTPMGTFKGIFDGNGYTISNLYINSNNSGSAFIKSTDRREDGSYTEIKNIKFDNTDVNSTNRRTAVIVGYAAATNIVNCSVEGSVNSSSIQTGGILGDGYYTTTSYCYADLDIIGTDDVGGISGTNNYSESSYCYTTGTISGDSVVGGIAAWGTALNCKSAVNISGNENVGGILGNSNASTSNNYFSGKVAGVSNVGGITGRSYQIQANYSDNIVAGSVSGADKVGIIIGSVTSAGATLQNNYFDGTMSFGLAMVGDGIFNSNNDIDLSLGTTFDLQVGINSDESSRLNYSTYISLPGLDSLQASGVTKPEFLENIDSSLCDIELKQTELGTAENRLLSVLEEISVKYENLLSSRSTIRDTDIADVSSEYIRQQILQQASATLLSTANQSPAFALQLL